MSARRSGTQRICRAVEDDVTVFEGVNRFEGMEGLVSWRIVRRGDDLVMLDDAGEGEVGVPVGKVEPHHVVQRMVRPAGQSAPGQGDVHLLDRPAGPVGVGRPAQEGVEPLLLVGVQQVLGERQHQHGGDAVDQVDPHQPLDYAGLAPDAAAAAAGGAPGAPPAAPK